MFFSEQVDCLSEEAAFIRVPGHVLAGHVERVQDSPDLSHCLSLCLRHDCKSVMYNYDMVTRHF